VKDILVGFKSFLLRGNLIEVAVALVIALAFVAVVNSFVSNIVTPVIALIFGEPSVGALDVTINNAVFNIGFFIDDVITFVAIAAAIYFFVVVPYTRITDRMKRGEEPDATTKVCSECITTIPLEARRCPACTSQLV
jgi:large conductance mechanosensitive channel